MSSADAAGRPLLVMFICNHCPFVKHIRTELATIGREYLPRRIAIAAISSNDPSSYPADGPNEMVHEACEAGYCFPYLFDPTQDVARAFDAQCTPDFFLFDAGHRLVYRGRLDESSPRSAAPVTGRELRAALDAVLEGREVPATQLPSIGCSIKWRAVDSASV